MFINRILGFLCLKAGRISVTDPYYSYKNENGIWDLECEAGIYLCSELVNADRVEGIQLSHKYLFQKQSKLQLTDWVKEQSKLNCISNNIGFFDTSYPSEIRNLGFLKSFFDKCTEITQSSERMGLVDNPKGFVSYAENKKYSLLTKSNRQGLVYGLCILFNEERYEDTFLLDRYDSVLYAA